MHIGSRRVQPLIRMARHISSVVPSPHTTYRGSVPCSAGSCDLSEASCRHRTRRVSPGPMSTGLGSGTAPACRNPSSDVEQVLLVGLARVQGDGDLAAQQVHVTGDREHRGGRGHRTIACLHRAGSRRIRVAAAEQLQPAIVAPLPAPNRLTTSSTASVRSHNRPDSPGAQGNSTGAGSNAVRNGLQLLVRQPQPHLRRSPSPARSAGCSASG